MEKIHEPDGYDTAYCPRCDTCHCAECVDFKIVEFDVEESQGGLATPLIKQNWKRIEVCPWCYNQLLGIHQKIHPMIITPDEVEKMKLDDD